MKTLPKYKVAIKCLVYNHEPYLRECLEGFVMQQTDFPFVAIVHDDASTDHSADIIREYAAKYPDIIHPIYETENQYSKKGSLTKIMNDAIEATGAPYIAFCEGDDYGTAPHTLQKQVDFLDTHPNVGLCYTDCDIYYEDENQWERAIYTTAGETFNARNIKEKRTVWYMANNTWVYSKSLYDQIAPNPGYIDGALYLLYNMCLLADVEYVEGVTSVYRRHKGSASCFSNVDERRAYQYQKSCFFLEARFTPKFPNSETNLKELYNYALFCLYERALKYNDKEVIEKIEEHFSPLLDMRMYQSLISQKQRYERTQYSKAYKLGRLLLQPIKWLKK